MKKILVILGILAILPFSNAFASCSSVGSSTFCSDGNTYTTIGKSTYGSNSRTGTSWSSHQSGKLSYGTDSSGRSWSYYND